MAVLVADGYLSFDYQVDACSVFPSPDDAVAFAESGEKRLHYGLHRVDHLDRALLRHEREESVELAVHR